VSIKRSSFNRVIKISHIGYKTKTLLFNDTVDTIRVFLAPVSYELKPIDIIAERTQEKYLLGYHKIRNLLPTSLTISALGKRVIAAVLVKPRDTIDKIETAVLNLRSNSQFSKFKFFLMSVGKEGFPTDTILKKLLDANKFGNKIIVDISEHEITIPPEGIFVAFEWWRFDLSERDQIKILTTDKYDNNNSYLFSENLWIPFENYFSERDKSKNFSIGLILKKKLTCPLFSLHSIAQHRRRFVSQKLSKSKL
jgi:hypothetical protein